MKRRSVFSRSIGHSSVPAVVILGIILLIGSPIFAQESRDLLFQGAKMALDQANASNATLLSPTQYRTAMKYYNQAEEDYEKGRSPENVQEKLKLAEVYFARAVETTKLFQTNMSKTISARNDALAVEAPSFRQISWQEAEAVLLEAAKILEDGKLENAQVRAEKAMQMYRDVELEAIMANYLDETKELIKTREKELRKKVPLTFNKANELVSTAERQLSENRYDTDEARQKAQEAKYEIAHAIYMASLMDRMEEQDQTLESTLLGSENPIKKIADELNQNARFHQGTETPVATIIGEIQTLKREIATLQQDVTDKSEQITTLSNQISTMESQLGDLKSKEANLSALMEKQRRSREKFKQIEEAFQPEEAQVLRIEDRVIIRLYGLSFPVGKATIEPQYYGILTKVLKSIDVYPNSMITIEGHTDSWGSDETNQQLSTERATAVREYFMATASMDSLRVSAVGFGESKPIATNETVEGRRKNRRIETIIVSQEE